VQKIIWLQCKNYLVSVQKLFGFSAKNIGFQYKNYLVSVQNIFGFSAKTYLVSIQKLFDFSAKNIWFQCKTFGFSAKHIWFQCKTYLVSVQKNLIPVQKKKDFGAKSTKKPYYIKQNLCQIFSYSSEENFFVR
jgi:hypothetical protein